MCQFHDELQGSICVVIRLEPDAFCVLRLFLIVLAISAGVIGRIVVTFLLTVLAFHIAFSKIIKLSDTDTRFRA